MNSIQNTPSIHCTQFMLDFCPEWSNQNANSLQHYVMREENYDLNFCAAWLNHSNTESIDDAEQYFEFFMKIQKVAMLHIEQLGRTSMGQSYESGICAIKGYGYDVNKGFCSNFEGIKELARQIWFDQKKVTIILYSKMREDNYYKFRDVCVLENKRFYKRIGYYNLSSNRFERRSQKIWEEINDYSENQFAKILDKIHDYYDVEAVKGHVPVFITSQYENLEEKKAKAIELFNDYLLGIRDLTSKDEKIVKICELCRELEQLHLFFDGNGRSVYILANILLDWNGLNLFYPRNMCMFDANSLSTMVQEIIEGQERFASMFGSKEQLSKHLSEYHVTVVSLVELTKEKFSKFNAIMTSVKERNFNLLLRQSAAKKEAQELLEFLLKHMQTLNIDIHSKGEKSGTAMDVAIKNENEVAINLLSEYLPSVESQK